MCTSCHSHSHHHSNHNHSNNKIFFIKTILAILLLITAILCPLSTVAKIVLYLSAYLISALNILKDALKSILKGLVFDENFLMSLATICALIIGEYPEAVMVALLYQIGEFLQEKAVSKSKNSITKLIDLRQDSANILKDDKIETIDAKKVKVNDIIVVKKGEKIPLDGVIIDGCADIDTSSLTGESMPKYSTKGDSVLSGTILTDGFLKIKVEREFNNSTASKILRLIEESSNKKAQAEKFITKFAKIYTPMVVLLAILLVIIPCVFYSGDFNLWFKRALTFLVISCPCALVISIPLGFFAGIGKASKSGILIKGSEYIEKLTKISAFVFDKTGTLTKGSFSIEKVVSLSNKKEEEILELISKIESFSNHPIAKAFKEYSKNLNLNNVSDINEVSGNGICAKIDNKTYFVGRKSFILSKNITLPDTNEEAKTIYLADDKSILGYITLSDELKANALDAIKKLKQYCNNIIILSGDNENAVKKTAKELNIDKFYYSLLPQDKLSILENIIKNKKNNNVIYTGDGINDAPSLKISDIGIAIGKYKTDSAIEASDVVIMNDNLLKIPQAVKISKDTMRIVKENIIFSIFVKILFLILGAIGFIGIQGAVFADVGVTLIAVLNSLRILR